MSEKINSPFVRPSDRKVYKGVETGETDYIDRKVYMEYVETGRDENGKSIGSVQPVVKETKTNIQKLIQSHESEVGLKNLIALYLRTGDSSLFNQRKSINSLSGSKELDVTKLPEKSAQEIYGEIPEALKGNKSMEEFLKTLTKDQFEAFVKSLRESTEKTEIKEEKVDE